MRCNQTVASATITNRTTIPQEPRRQITSTQTSDRSQKLRGFVFFYLKDVSVLYFVLDGVVVCHDSTHDGKPGRAGRGNNGCWVRVGGHMTCVLVHQQSPARKHQHSEEISCFARSLLDCVGWRGRWRETRSCVLDGGIGSWSGGPPLRSKDDHSASSKPAATLEKKTISLTKAV